LEQTRALRNFQKSETEQKTTSIDTGKMVTMATKKKTVETMVKQKIK